MSLVVAPLELPQDAPARARARRARPRGRRARARGAPALGDLAGLETDAYAHFFVYGVMGITAAAFAWKRTGLAKAICGTAAAGFATILASGEIPFFRRHAVDDTLALTFIVASLSAVPAFPPRRAR